MARTEATQEEFSNRVRFNWGYHDAANDVLRRGRPKSLVADGRNTPGSTLTNGVVSFAQDAAYAAGYREGLVDAKSGVYANNSQAAWERTAPMAWQNA